MKHLLSLYSFNNDIENLRKEDNLSIKDKISEFLINIVLNTFLFRRFHCIILPKLRRIDYLENTQCHDTGVSAIVMEFNHTIILLYNILIVWSATKKENTCIEGE